MCLGIPMEVVTSEGLLAQCRNGDQAEQVDISLIGEVSSGDWLLVHLGAARQRLDADDAHAIRDALNAVSAVMQGDHSIDHLFADLVDREPQLPPHLQPDNDGKLP
ncbi:MAG TPA: HypC/HybG/HupF family hydrogenase formation chaperone [Gammaproteobacteria bacterium]|jgi:hydrogenase assembly chaperone HypC/HupF|nr:HypC/HybG/HupF family hydrogenase formation chaperone [Gammaproteobacteria bacterium]